MRILDMVRPLDLERTYVRISIQEEQSRRYVDAEEMAALAQGDPNLLFELTQDKLAEDKVESLFPEDALRRYRNMVVLGDPGAGKTTMLKYLCLLLAQGKAHGLPDLPIFVTLNRYAKTTNTGLFDFIITELNDRYGFQEASSYLQSRMDEGSVLLLLDGLDEVTVGSTDEAEVVYRHTVNEINHLATRHPKCPIVVTSRRAGWKGLLAPTFMIMAVLDFSWGDIQHFLDNWFGAGSDRSRDLQNKLSRQIRMQALAANPLLLSLIAIVFEQDLDLPERRAKLYERCVHVLLTEWDAHRGIKRASYFTADRKRDLLEEVALHFHCQGLRYFPRDDLLGIIASYLPTVNIPADQAELVLAEISAQHALLKEQATDWYGFLHLTLQEYFCAVRLDRGNELERALAQMHNPWWEEVILLLAGMLRDAAPLLQMIPLDQDDIFFGNLLLASRCLAGTPRISDIKLREHIINQLKALIENESIHWLPRSQAMQTLQEAQVEKSSSYLRGLLSNHAVRWQVRVAAVDSFGTSRDKTLANHLVELLAKEQIDLNVRERIADALVNICDKSIASRLLALISNEQIDPQVRGRVAKTIGLLGDRGVVEALLAILADKALNNNVAWDVGIALVNLQFTSEPKELYKLLRDRNVNRVGRWALAKGADKFDETAGLEIVSWLSDKSLELDVRWSFAYRLGRYGPEILEDLRKLYVDNGLDLTLRAAIGISLLYLGDKRLVVDLKQFLLNHNVNYYIRRKLAEALVLLGEREMGAELMSLLREQALENFVSLKAAHLLGTLGDSAVVPDILDFLWQENIDVHVRMRAADALSALELNDYVTEVRKLVIDNTISPQVRGRAVHCLVQADQGVTWLTELLDHSDIGEEVYLALHTAARRSGVRIFPKAEGGYKTVPLQHIENLPA